MIHTAKMSEYYYYNGRRSNSGVGGVAKMMMMMMCTVLVVLLSWPDDGDVSLVVHGYSMSMMRSTSTSSFIGRENGASFWKQSSRGSSRGRRGDMVMYGPNDASDERNTNNNGKGNRDNGNPHPDVTGVWSALATMETWISETLSNSGPENPYKRKEVSYVCETSTDTTFIVAGLFRRVKEAREVGELHGQQQQQRNTNTNTSEEQRPHTLRQTQVVVIPWSDTLNEYHHFQAIMEAITRARRNARDLYVVTDPVLPPHQHQHQHQALDDWTVSINAAGLHPQFGQKTPPQMLQEMKEDEQQPPQEFDVNLKEYMERKNKARQSPYPSVVVEVRATPNMFKTDQTTDHAPPNDSPTSNDNNNNNTSNNNNHASSSPTEESPSKQDLQRLEAMFALSAATKPDTTTPTSTSTIPVEEEDDTVDFYDAIGKAFGNQQVSMETPDNLARIWVQQNDDQYVDDSTSTFISCDTKNVDAAYEFVFYNIAMHLHSSTTIHNNNNKNNNQNNSEQHISYLIMPHFVPTSATSFEKFAIEVDNIISIIPGLSDRVSSVSTLHPEHIHLDHRSNVPIFVLEWNDY